MASRLRDHRAMLALDASLIAGRFALEERLSDQGRFEAHRGIEVASRRRVRIRFLNQAQGLARLEIEKAAKAMMRIPHPGIVPVLEVGVHLGRPFLVTPWIDAPTLAELLGLGQPPPLATALSILAQVGEALEHAHRCGVIHGGLTPAAILVPKEGRVQLADCGFAHWVEVVTSERPSSVPPPLPSPAADLEALRRLTQSLIVDRVSFTPAPMPSVPPPFASSQPPPSWPAVLASQRVMMPVLATPPPSLPPSPAQPAVPSLAPQPPALPRASQPAMDMTPTEKTPAVELPLSFAPEIRPLSNDTIPMRSLPPETVDADPVIIALDAGLPEEPPVIQRPEPVRGAQRSLDLSAIDESLIPKQVLLARRAAAWTRVQMQHPRLRPLAEKLGLWLPRARSTFFELRTKALIHWHRLDRPPVVSGDLPLTGEIQAAGVIRWQTMSWPQRGILAAGAIMALWMVVFLLSGPGEPSKKLPAPVAPRVEAMAPEEAAPAVATPGGQTEAKGNTQAQPAKKQSNVERLRSGKRFK